jgi:hypothetical protein
VDQYVLIAEQPCRDAQSLMQQMVPGGFSAWDYVRVCEVHPGRIHARFSMAPGYSQMYLRRLRLSMWTYVLRVLATLVRDYQVFLLPPCKAVPQNDNHRVQGYFYAC